MRHSQAIASSRFRASAAQATTWWNFGQWAKAALFNDEQAIAWCKRDRSLTIERAQSEGVNTAGGFLVPTQFENEIIVYRNAAGVFRNEARSRQMLSDSLTQPVRSGGTTAYFVGENSQITESQAAWANLNLNAKKTGAITRLSSEFEGDSTGIGEWLTEEMGFSFADLEDSCGFNGDGSSAYGGIKGITQLLIDGQHNAGKVTAGAGHDLFPELDAPDLAALMAALPEKFWQTAKFFVSAYGAAQAFMRLGAVAGGPIMTISGPRPQITYLGMPVVLVPKLPGSGSQTGKVMVLFGDLYQAAVIGSRRGMTAQVSQSRYLELDQVALRGTERFDIVNHGLGDNTTAGPLVGLVGA